MNREDAELRRVQAFSSGNSFSIVLPKKFVAVLELQKGDYVKMKLVNKTIVCEKFVP